MIIWGGPSTLSYNPVKFELNWHNRIIITDLLRQSH